MGPRFLIDTNVAIEFVGLLLPPATLRWLQPVFDQQLYALSVINRIELFSRLTIPPVDYALRQLVQSATVFPLDEPVILETIRIRQQYRRKLPDAIIAATALVHGCEIVTRNVADFRAITGLTVLDPYDPANLPQLV